MATHHKVMLLFALFAIIITSAWKWYEIAAYGEVRPDSFDSIIALILSASLTVNVMLYRFLKNVRRKNGSSDYVVE